MLARDRHRYQVWKRQGTAGDLAVEKHKCNHANLEMKRQKVATLRWRFIQSNGVVLLSISTTADARER